MVTRRAKKNPLVIFTIGHSTRTLKEFIALLQHYNITYLIDIRTIPRSQHNPQFNESHLAKTLKKHHISYTHMSGLGGLRHTTLNSINTAWHNASFRGFADYMQTESFKKGIETLLKHAKHGTIALMCAEAVPWRCHRSLIGDALVVRHLDVQDIFSKTTTKAHTLTPWAKVRGKNITYPAKD